MDTYVVVANAMMMMTMVISPFLLLFCKRSFGPRGLLLSE